VNKDECIYNTAHCASLSAAAETCLLCCQWCYNQWH